jgi:uncharacterized membrane protein
MWPKTKCPERFFAQHGDLAGCDTLSTANDISADGERVVGYSSADETTAPNDCSPLSAHKQEASGWTRLCSASPRFWPSVPKGTTGLIGLGYLPSNAQGSIAYGISPDGVVAVGWSDFTANNNAPAVFLPSGVKKLELPHAIGSAADISDGGELPGPGGWGEDRPLMKNRIIVGYTSESGNYPWYVPDGHAVLWNSWTSIVMLTIPPIPNGQTVISSEAVCISDDGMTIGGELYYNIRGEKNNFRSYPCVWTFGSGVFSPEVLKDLDGGDTNARITHISGDGHVVVGWGTVDVGDSTCQAYPKFACKWTKSSSGWSDPQALKPLPGSPYSSAAGTNGDGSIVVGSSYSYGVCPDVEFKSRATLWHGTAYLDVADGLKSAVPPGVTLWEAVRVSQNGRIVTGYSWTDGFGRQEGWTAGLK